MALANETVLDRFPGAATTLTVVTVQDGVFRAMQVGDSEALLTGQRGRLKYHTTQHSPTGFAVEAGYLDERLALYHPERHLVSNFVGTWEMRIELGKPQRLNLLDTIVLASDGLTDNLFRHEIVDLARKGPGGETLDSLIRVAQTRMLDPFSGLPSKPDDLTILLFRPRFRAAP